MEIEKTSTSTTSTSSSWWTSLSSSMGSLGARMSAVPKNVKKIGQDDPRRIMYSLKVGLALTIISFFYYVNPLFNNFRTSAIWALLTVIVVMEYTVGGTLSKGLNRTFATMLAGALAVGAHCIADFAGEKGEPVVLGVFVFVLAAAATFSRFIPEIKKTYDYGVVIFILTFSLVAVSSYRTEDVIQLAQQRLSTIAIGVATCLCTTFFVFPVWAGEELHKQAALNLEKLASFLEGFGTCYFNDKDGVEKPQDQSFMNSYKSVLNSKATEEALANFAKWEPGHGRFSFRHPWSQYLKIGTLSRQCAYSIDALTACVATCEKVKTKDSDYHKRIRAVCLEMSTESSKVMTGLASAIRTFKVPSTANQHVVNSTSAVDKLMAILAEDGLAVTPGILQAATIASLLAQVISCATQSAAAVEELARLAHFKTPPSTEPIHKATVKTVAVEECPHIVIEVKE